MKILRTLLCLLLCAAMFLSGCKKDEFTLGDVMSVTDLYTLYEEDGKCYVLYTEKAKQMCPRIFSDTDYHYIKLKPSPQYSSLAAMRRGILEGSNLKDSHLSKLWAAGNLTGGKLWVCNPNKLYYPVLPPDSKLGGAVWLGEEYTISFDCGYPFNADGYASCMPQALWDSDLERFYKEPDGVVSKEGSLESGSVTYRVTSDILVRYILSEGGKTRYVQERYNRVDQYGMSMCDLFCWGKDGDVYFYYYMEDVDEFHDEDILSLQLAPAAVLNLEEAQAFAKALSTPHAFVPYSVISSMGEFVELILCDTEACTQYAYVLQEDPRFTYVVEVDHDPPVYSPLENITEAVVPWKLEGSRDETTRHLGRAGVRYTYEQGTLTGFILFIKDIRLSIKFTDPALAREYLSAEDCDSVFKTLIYGTKDDVKQVVAELEDLYRLRHNWLPS